MIAIYNSMLAYACLNFVHDHLILNLQMFYKFVTNVVAFFTCLLFLCVHLHKNVNKSLLYC